MHRVDLHAVEPRRFRHFCGLDGPADLGLDLLGGQRFRHLGRVMIFRQNGGRLLGPAHSPAPHADLHKDFASVHMNPLCQPDCGLPPRLWRVGGRDLSVHHIRLVHLHVAHHVAKDDQAKPAPGPFQEVLDRVMVVLPLGARHQIERPQRRYRQAVFQNDAAHLERLHQVWIGFHVNHSFLLNPAAQGAIPMADVSALMRSAGHCLFA